MQVTSPITLRQRERKYRGGAKELSAFPHYSAQSLGQDSDMTYAITLSVEYAMQEIFKGDKLPL